MVYIWEYDIKHSFEEVKKFLQNLFGDYDERNKNKNNQKDK